jgi:aubergine-like protein
MENPPPGSIIDSDLVENQQNNICFDFFLVPQMTTQGCVLPTHFFVSLNESKDLSKEDLESLTYNLCYMYSNWSGSIKVPSPCQHAHKIAEYHNNFDSKGVLKKSSNVEQKVLNYNPKFCTSNYHL